jgi:hypothetical protein
MYLGEKLEENQKQIFKDKTGNEEQIQKRNKNYSGLTI